MIFLMERQVMPLKFNSNRLIESCILFTGLMFLYMWTSPPSVVFEDDGFFIMAAYHWGVAHPPGYPLHTLLGKVFTYIPIGTIAFRVHLLSAVCGAGTAVCIYYIVDLLTNDRAASLLSGLLLGLMKTFWSQSIIAEVYTLNTLIFFLLFLYLLKCILEQRLTNARAIVIGTLTGFGCSVHWPLFVLAFPALLFIAWGNRFGINNRRFFLLLLIGLSVGLSPYLIMVIRSQMDPVISFYGPIDSWRDFWFIVSREGYESVDYNPDTSWKDKLKFFAFFIRSVTLDSGVVAMLVCFAGIRLWLPVTPKPISWALLWIVILHVLILILLLGFKYDGLTQVLFRVYPLVAYGGLAIVLGLSTAAIQHHPFMTKKYRRYVLYISVLLPLLFNYSMNNRHNDSFARDYAETLLVNIDPESRLLIGGDIEIGVLGYYLHVEKKRTDIELINMSGTVFNNRRFSPLVNEEMDYPQMIERLRGEGSWDIYLTARIPDYAFSDQWLTVKLHDIDENNISIPKQSRQFYQRLLSQEPPNDPWGEHHRSVLLSTMARLLVHQSAVQRQSNNHWDIQNSLNVLIQQDFYAAVAAVEEMLRFRDQFSPHELLEYMSAVPSPDSMYRFTREEAFYFRILGDVLTRNKKYGAAIEAYTKSIRISPVEENPAIKKLQELCSRVEDCAMTSEI